MPVGVEYNVQAEGPEHSQARHQEMVSRCEVGFTSSFPPLLIQCLTHGPKRWFSTMTALESPYAPRPNPERLGIDLGGPGHQYSIVPPDPTVQPGLDLLASRKGSRQPGWGIAEVAEARYHLSLTTEELLSVQPVRRLDRVGLDLSSFEFRVWLSLCSPALWSRLSPTSAVPKVLLRQYSPHFLLGDRR